MEIKNNKFNIGDKVYTYASIRQYVEFQCPFCGGKGYVNHPLNEGSVIECLYCQGYNPVKEYTGLVKTLNKKICYKVTNILIEINDKNEVSFRYTLETFNPKSGIMILTEKEQNMVLVSEVE